MKKGKKRREIILMKNGEGRGRHGKENNVV